MTNTLVDESFIPLAHRVPQCLADCGVSQGCIRPPLDFSGLASEAGLACRVLVSGPALDILMPGTMQLSFRHSVRVLLATLAELGPVLAAQEPVERSLVEVTHGHEPIVVYKNFEANPPFAFLDADVV